MKPCTECREWFNVDGACPVCVGKQQAELAELRKWDSRRADVQAKVLRAARCDMGFKRTWLLVDTISDLEHGTRPPLKLEESKPE